MLPEHDFLLWSSHLLLTSTYNNKSVSHSKNNKDAVTPICKENKVRSVPLLSKTQLLHVQVVPACGSEELLEATVGRSGCCWCRDVSPLSMDLSAAPKAIPPAHPLYLTWQTGAYGCLLMLCCSYVLSGLMVHRGSGGFAWRGGKEGPAKGGLHPWEVEWPEVSVVCHKSNWILGNDWQTLSKQCQIRDLEMVNAYTAS